LELTAGSSGACLLGNESFLTIGFNAGFDLFLVDQQSISVAFGLPKAIE